MNYGTVCSGIGAPEVALDGLGWHGVFCSEISAFPAAVLEYRFPGLPNFGDFTKITNEKIKNDGRWPDGGASTLDVLIGGTPCQSFSLAGLRGGLGAANGNLALEFVRLLARLRPRWFVWENVPGVFSSDGGADFAAILGGFTGRRVTIPVDGWKNAGAIDGIPAAYDVSWRVLDAQFAGVAQRRRRVFVVGHLAEVGRRLGNGPGGGMGGGKLQDAGGFPNMAAAVLFEREGLRWDPAPSGKARQKAAGILRGGAARRCVAVVGNGQSVETETCNTLDAGCKDGPVRNQTGIAVVETRHGEWPENCVPSLRASGACASGGSEALICMGSGQARTEVLDDLATCLTCNHEAPIIALQLAHTGANGCNMSTESWPTVDTCAGSIGVCYPINTQLGLRGETSNTSREGLGLGDEGDPQFTLLAGHSHAVCYGFHGQASETQGVRLQSEMVPALDTSKQVNVCYGLDQSMNANHELVNALRAQSNGQVGNGATCYGFKGGQGAKAGGLGIGEEISPTLTASQSGSNMAPCILCRQSQTVIRRLLPQECAMLQGFPPNWCMIPWRGKSGLGTAWAPQYHGIGNSMAVPVLRWLGMRLDLVQGVLDLLTETGATK